MADINTQIAAIENAVYGEEVRGAISTALTAMNDNAVDAEAWANGTRNGTAIGSSDPAYHKDAKYWSEQASAALPLDTTLSVSGKAADAAAVGAAVLVRYTGTLPESAMDLPGNVWLTATGQDLQSILGVNFTWTLVSANTYVLRKYTINASSNTYRYEVWSMGGPLYYTGWTISTSTAIQWGPVIDDSLSVSGRAADAKATGDALGGCVKKLGNLIGANSYDVLAESSRNSTSEKNGITYTWDAAAGTYTITGATTSSDFSFKNLIVSQDGLPAGVNPGDTIYIKASGLSASGVRLQIFISPTADIPNSNFYIYGDTPVYIPANCTGITLRFFVPTSTTLPEGGVAVSVKVLTGPDQHDISDQINANSVKLLVFGASYSYSTLGYVPAIMQEIAPETRFVLGICYDDGQSIGGHMTKWDNNAAYTIYSEYDSRRGTWINERDSVTGKQAAMRFRWDYIVLQPNIRNDPTDATTKLEAFADKISQYVTWPIDFLYNLVQALNAGATNFPSQYTGTGKEKSDAMYRNIAAAAQAALEKETVSAVIPGGTAVQTARTSSLDDIQTNAGDLSDDNYGHLQNGLPVLIPCYTSAYKICELAGIKAKMRGIQLSPTDAWLTSYNLATATSHGSCVGVTEANKIIAQKCALMAIKYPFEISDMSSY